VGIESDCSRVRGGSAEISFRIPGIDKDVIFPLESQAGWCFRSFSDQFWLCHRARRAKSFGQALMMKA